MIEWAKVITEITIYLAISPNSSIIHTKSGKKRLVRKLFIVYQLYIINNYKLRELSQLFTIFILIKI